MARLSTRKGLRSNRGSTRRGGASSYASAPNSQATTASYAPAPNSRAATATYSRIAPETCVSLLRKLLPDRYDFERMKNEGFKNVKDMTYEQFTQANVAVVEAMTEADSAFYKSLFERIAKRNVKAMDLEDVTSFVASNVFFDKKGRVVIVSPR